MENEEKELKANLEKEKLNEAAEALKNMDFNSDNYKELLDLINRISALASSNKHEEEIERDEPHETESMNQEAAVEQTEEADNGIQSVKARSAQGLDRLYSRLIAILNREYKLLPQNKSLKTLR